MTPHDIARREVDAGRFAGILWCTRRDGVVVDEGAVGHADHALARPLERDAILRLYSMTKPVVSFAALMAIERGELSLADPVARHLPEFAPPGVLADDGAVQSLARAPTVEDLLTHRAGLSYDFLPGCPVAELYRREALLIDGSRSLADLVDRLGRLPLVAQPGTRWRYSVATDVLARVLEVVEGRPLGEILDARLFAPLGTRDTGFGVAPAARGRLVEMHGQRDLDVEMSMVETDQSLWPMQVERSYPVDRPTTFARGGLGLYSTLDDYLRFMALLRDGCTTDDERLLSRSLLHEAWRNRLPAEQRPITIAGRRYEGYGWGLLGRVMVDVDDAAAAGLAASPGEGGWSGAASTWFWVDRARRVEGIVLAQYLGAEVPLGLTMQAAAYRSVVG